ncbi:MAG: thioredoxin family protein [Desulfobulbus sp.]|nr:thioredoxin family protein [Desulfobulbus sp.]
MKIQILGPGCAKCTKLMDTAAAAAKELGIACEFEKISDVNQIMSHGVMMTPALVVNGEVKSVGKIPSLEDMKKLLQ